MVITGIKESEIISGVDVSYIEPTNHYKREVVRADTADANDGIERNVIKNIQSLDLPESQDEARHLDLHNIKLQLLNIFEEI